MVVLSTKPLEVMYGIIPSYLTFLIYLCQVFNLKTLIKHNMLSNAVPCLILIYWTAQRFKCKKNTNIEIKDLGYEHLIMLTLIFNSRTLLLSYVKHG